MNDNFLQAECPQCGHDEYLSAKGHSSLVAMCPVCGYKGLITDFTQKNRDAFIARKVQEALEKEGKSLKPNTPIKIKYKMDVTKK